MQALFSSPAYAQTMEIKSHLRELREAAGLSVRELARQIGEQHTNVLYWETSGNLPRSNVLVPMATALGVSVEELLGQPKPIRTSSPAGKARLAFERVAKLPRRQQDQIIKVINALIAQHDSAKTA